MNEGLHERARMLIALAGPEAADGTEQAWLASHLDACPECREFAERARQTVQAMRTIPITAGWSLVSTTQARVRQRARELQRQREWMAVAWVCCTAVMLCTALGTVGLWRGCEWFAQHLQLPSPIWQVLLACASVLPAIFAAVLLLARGTHLSDQNWEG